MAAFTLQTPLYKATMGMPFICPDVYKRQVIVRPGKKLKTGHRVVFGNGELTADVPETLETGRRIVKF